jgi:hypothetical protein
VRVLTRDVFIHVSSRSRTQRGLFSRVSSSLFLQFSCHHYVLCCGIRQAGIVSRLLGSRTALAHSRVSHSCVAAPGRLRLEEDVDDAGVTPVEDDGGGHDDADAAE